MFDFNPADVRVATSEGYTNAPMLGAFAGYGGMLQGIGKKLSCTQHRITG